MWRVPVGTIRAMPGRSRNQRWRFARVVYSIAVVVGVLAALHVLRAKSLGDWRYLYALAVMGFAALLEVVIVRAWGNHKVRARRRLPWLTDQGSTFSRER